MASETMSLSMLQFIPSRKDEKDLVTYGGYLYEKGVDNEEDGSADSYFCNRRKLGCRGRLTVDQHWLRFRVSKGHSHDPGNGNGSRCLTRSTMAKIVAQNLKEGGETLDGVKRKIRLPKRRTQAPKQITFLHSPSPPPARDQEDTPLTSTSRVHTEVGAGPFVKDQLLYKMTPPSNYISFIMMLGTALLAYLLHPTINSCGRELHYYHENYDITSTAFNSSADYKLAHLSFQKHEIFQMDFAELLEREVNLTCNQYRKEWESSIEYKLKGEEYLQRNIARENELSILLAQFREKLEIKQQKLDNLVWAAKTFREDHISIPISSIYQFFNVIYICCLVCWFFGYITYRYYYFI